MQQLSRKFKQLDVFYPVQQSSYTLLPFRFTKLDQKKYVITNLVGEFIILNRDELELVVNKKIKPTENLYNSLKSKHFIVDDSSNVAIDLLAIKYRTIQHYISQFTGLHIFVVTLRCDYSCPYCQVSRQTADQSTYDMSTELADKSLDMVFKSPSRNIKIEFQGGEPLLNFSLIKHIVERAKEINKIKKRDLQFVIATNLTYLTQDILEFCLSHQIYISTSLDGPADLHNQNRPRPGKNGFELTVEGIKKIQAFLGRDYVCALMTTTEKSLDRVKEIIDTYISLGFNSVFLRPLSPYGFAVKTKQLKYDTQKWLQFFKEGLSYIVEVNQRGYFLVENYTSVILSKMFLTNAAGYVDLQSPAGIGISALVYNYNGNVYASDEARMLAEMNDETFKLGNVLEQSYEEIISSDALLDPIEASLAESVPMCNECAFLPYCGSDPVYHHVTQRDFIGNKMLSGFCSKNMEIFKHIFTLMEDNSAARKVLMSWIRA